MLFNLRLNNNIIRVPSFPANLKRIRVNSKTGNRAFGYEITLNVDMAKSLSLSGITMEVETFPRKPRKFNAKPRTVSPASYARSTKTLERSRISAAASRKKNRISRTMVDLTKYVSNQTASAAMRNCEQLARSLRGRNRRAAVTTCRLIKKNALKSLFSPKIITANSPFTPEKFTLVASSSISLDGKTSYPMRALAPEMLETTNTDPGQIFRYPLKRFPPIIAAQAQSVLFTPETKETVPHVHRVKSSTREVKFWIWVLEKHLGGKSSFYLNVRLLSDKGVLLAENGQSVQHSKQVNDFVTPSIPPIIEVATLKAGVNSIGVKQKDPHATRMKVFRRVAPVYTGGANTGTPWVEILDTTTTKSDDEIRFKDAVGSSSTILYRAISLGINSRPTDIFSSAVARPPKELKQVNTAALSAIAKYSLSENIVVIAVSDIPIDSVCVAVRRYNTTNYSLAEKAAGTGRGFEYVGAQVRDQVVYVPGSGNKSVTFRDTSIKSGTRYRYVPVATTKAGKEVIGTEALIDIVDAQTEDAKVALSVSSPVYASSNGIASVTFNLDAKFTDFGFDEVRRSLNVAGQGTLFNEDVFQERDKFAQLINFLVERENYRTGIVESFGVYETGEFTDNSDTRAEKNISPLRMGDKYSYKITALVRSAETLLQTLLESTIDITTLMKFSSDISKFRNPMALKGTLQSTARQSDFSKPSGLEPTDPFLAGRTSVEVSYDVTIPVEPGRTNVVTADPRRDNVLVKWSYNGPTSALDHFQVFVCANGGRQMIGTVHPDGDAAEYSFRHFTKGFAIPYFYEIHFIRLDYKPIGRIRSKTLRPKRYNKMIADNRTDQKVIRL